MTDKDKQSIEKAEKCGATDWFIVSQLEADADTDEARKILHNICTRLNHTEEFLAGVL